HSSANGKRSRDSSSPNLGRPVDARTELPSESGHTPPHFFVSSGPQAAAESSSEPPMVDGIINLKTTIHEWRSARELCVRKFRGSSYLQGVHSYDINEDGFTVYPRLETLISPSTDVNGELRRVSSGNSRLDEM